MESKGSEESKQEEEEEQERGRRMPTCALPPVLWEWVYTCLLYTSDAADDWLVV